MLWYCGSETTPDEVFCRDTRDDVLGRGDELKIAKWFFSVWPEYLTVRNVSYAAYAHAMRLIGEDKREGEYQGFYQLDKHYLKDVETVSDLVRKIDNYLGDTNISPILKARLLRALGATIVASNIEVSNIDFSRTRAACKPIRNDPTYLATAKRDVRELL